MKRTWLFLTSNNNNIIKEINSRLLGTLHLLLLVIITNLKLAAVSNQFIINIQPTKKSFWEDVEGSRIGNNNIIEARGRILGNTAIGNHCVIGAGCSTESNETIPDLTVIYGADSKRRIQSEPLPVCKYIYIYI